MSRDAPPLLFLLGASRSSAAGSSTFFTGVDTPSVSPVAPAQAGRRDLEKAKRSARPVVHKNDSMRLHARAVDSAAADTVDAASLQTLRHTLDVLLPVQAPERTREISKLVEQEWQAVSGELHGARGPGAVRPDVSAEAMMQRKRSKDAGKQKRQRPLTTAEMISARAVLASPGGRVVFAARVDLRRSAWGVEEGEDGAKNSAARTEVFSQLLELWNYSLKLAGPDETAVAVKLLHLSVYCTCFPHRN